jgi:hypothetical protein
LTISQKITQSMTASSWIRRMFEEGTRLKSQHGADNVFDFSLGNPVVEPPEAVIRALVDASSHSARADSAEEFRFGSGPVRRFVGTAEPFFQGITAESALPGGTSGVPGDPL